MYMYLHAYYKTHTISSIFFSFISSLLSIIFSKIYRAQSFPDCHRSRQHRRDQQRHQGAVAFSSAPGGTPQQSWQQQHRAAFDPHHSRCSGHSILPKGGCCLEHLLYRGLVPKAAAAKIVVFETVYLQAPAKWVWNLLHLMHIVSHTAAYVSSRRLSEAG